MKRILYIFTLLALLISACTANTNSTPQTGSVETIVASTFQAMTAAAPTATQTTSGIPVSLNGLSFTIPVGLATGATVESRARNEPAEGEDLPWWEKLPAHNEYTLQGYVMLDFDRGAYLYVYPVDEFIAANEDAAKIIQSLRDLLANPASLSTLKYLPFLPLIPAEQVFHSNVEMVSFQNGSGVRYLTQFSQFPSAITNGLVYTFQGLTSDGKYYVSTMLPVRVPFLLDPVRDAVLPADGIPFEPGDFAGHPAYVAAVTERLNATDPNIFFPALPNLDALIQSIFVSAQTVSAPPTSASSGSQPTTAPQVSGARTNNQFSFPSVGLSIKFNYPAQLKEGLANETVAAQSLQAPWETDYPEHIVVYFSAYSAPDSRDSNSPGIRVFRVADLNNFDPELLARLQQSQTPQTTQHEAFPYLPYPGHNVDAQFKSVTFQNGTGYRFLSAGSFGAQAPSSTGLTYSFTGITSDGKYLLSLRIGVDAPMIADLADGHAYISQDDATNYTNSLNARVNGGTDSQFDPSLAILDALVNSILVGAP